MKAMAFVDRYFIKKPLLRKFITKIYYGDNNKIIHLFNTDICINTTKENGYLRAFQAAERSSVFKDEVSNIINLASFFTDGCSFIDAGANVGLFSSVLERFSHIYNDIHVYAFEANPDTYTRLTKTAEGKNIQTFNVALSNINGELEFIEGVVSHVFAEKTHVRPYHLKNGRTIKIPAKRLDSFPVEGNLIILKIDVEGHEYEVLEGAKGFFDAGRVKVVYLDGFKKREQTMSFLNNYGFSLFDGKTFKPNPVDNFSLLALQRSR